MKGDSISSIKLHYCSEILTDRLLPVSPMYLAPQSQGIQYTMPSLWSGGGWSLAWTSKFLSVGQDLNAVLMLNLELKHLEQHCTFL